MKPETEKVRKKRSKTTGKLVAEWFTKKDEAGAPLTHAYIASKLGVSRENVRQWAKRLGLPTGRELQATRRRISRIRPIGPKGFTRRVNLVLKSIGYVYCSCCHRAVEFENLQKGGRICKRCVADKINLRYWRKMCDSSIQPRV